MMRLNDGSFENIKYLKVIPDFPGLLISIILFYGEVNYFIIVPLVTEVLMMYSYAGEDKSWGFLVYDY